MRKQTKLVAVLSAAALLAMGASMTSFAAGWEKDDAGVWHYYDRDDDMVTAEWRKDGGKWFYLDDDGDMLIDSWVDDDYYVGDDGAMLINQWKKTVTDDSIDDPDDDGERWFYFGSKGKKITSDRKKIGGKTYFFNEDGEMRDGWYQDGDNIYYLGEEDEGWRAENQWLWLERPTDDDDPDDGDWEHPDDCDYKCDDEGWYWFGSDGKMFKDATKKKSINGKYYYFNAHGQMLYEWINTNGPDGNTIDSVVREEEDAATASEAKPATVAQADNSKVVGDMRYANQVEDGSRITGWREIEGSEDARSDGDTDWYYFDDGEAEKADVTKPRDMVRAGGKNAKDGDDYVYRARIKCEGKYFCFNELGQMQTGLQWVDGSVYYFDGSGYMKTGKVADIEEEDNDLYNYYFTTKSGGNGKGINGEKDGYLYWNGKRLEADDDYRFYRVDGETYLVNNKGKLQKTSKRYDLEDFNVEDVYVKINRSTYAVQGFDYTISRDKLTIRSEGSTANPISRDDLKKLIANEYIAVPSISIYDNIFAPDDVLVGDYRGYFYGTDEDTLETWIKDQPNRAD